MPENNLLTRLANQLRSRGVSGSREKAAAILAERGHMKDGKLTPKGRERQKMGAAGRAKDRAAKASGHSPSDYKYNPKTNRATLRK